MAENILKSEAEKTLLSSFRMRCNKRDIISQKIVSILKGHHKTYKYILITGLLAKATNNNVNPLALQAGAPITGAYDARSLCHKVVVEFERNFLKDALGGSNEPFLNKPARYTHLSIDNAVRKGNDKTILSLLIQVFTSISTDEDAKAYLACALQFLNTRVTEINLLQNTTIKHNPTLIEIYEFIFRFLEKSLEGETSVIIVETLEKLYYSKLSQDSKVIVHKINQSGASSKEIGDIDIYINDEFKYAIEVKDKNFSPFDFDHAFKKMQSAGSSKGQFIYGPNGSFDSVKINGRILQFEKENFFILFQDIYSYSRTLLFKIDLNNKQEFIDTLMFTAIEMNSKENTKKWIQSLLIDLNWK